MNFTIAEMVDIQGDIKVKYGKDGNKYTVGIRNEETKEYTHNTYASKEDAYKVFSKLTKAIIDGCYSYEQRKSFLN